MDMRNIWQSWKNAGQEKRMGNGKVHDTQLLWENAVGELKRFFLFSKILVGIPVFFGTIKFRGICKPRKGKKQQEVRFHVSETENI